MTRLLTLLFVLGGSLPAYAQFGEERFFFLNNKKPQTPPAQSQPQRSAPPSQPPQGFQRLQPQLQTPPQPVQQQSSPGFWWPFRRPEQPQLTPPQPNVIVPPLDNRPRQEVDSSVAPAPRPRESPASYQVVVFGDSLADWMGFGLEEAFADVADVGILRKHRAGASLVRSDGGEILSQIKEPVKADAYVILSGINDRSPLKDRETSVDFGEERWRELYSQRLDHALEFLKTTGKPVFWVGLPAMKGTRFTRDAQFLNDILRERVLKAGLTYIDVWDGFIDEAGAFAQFGADLEGQRRRLRSYDGIHFTKAGARKIAHFVERELRRFVSVRLTPSVSSPENSAPASSAPAVRPAAARPVAGAVVPLGLSFVPGATLAGGKGGNPSVDGDVQRVLLQGQTPAPLPGRGDDFSWPKKLSQ